MKKLIALALLAGLIYAIKVLPWWGGVALVVGGAFLGIALFKRLVMNFFVGAFKAKSAVLKGASARVLSISPAEPPKPAAEGDEDEGFDFEFEEPRRWVHVDVEISVPGNADTPMSHWEPHELSLVREDAKPDDLMNGEGHDDEEVGTVAGVEIWQDGAWRTLDEKVCGSQRLRLHVAAREGVDRFKIRYYFELLANAS